MIGRQDNTAILIHHAVGSDDAAVVDGQGIDIAGGFQFGLRRFDGA
jgi:hypothetical protein